MRFYLFGQKGIKQLLQIWWMLSVHMAFHYTSLTQVEAAKVTSELIDVEDWEFDQGAIPRFLNTFVNLFPDETYDLLINRIERSIQKVATGGSGLRSIRLVHQNISFNAVSVEKRLQLGQDCISRLLKTDSGAVELSDLYWIVVGYEESSFARSAKSCR